MAATKQKYSMPRGDSRSFPLAVPVDTYSTGASIFFALKKAIDDDATDGAAVLKKELTDADIQSQDVDNVNYLMVLEPGDTNEIALDTYLAEFEFVSADKSIVITFPDPDVTILLWKISGDVNRRTS